MDDQRVIELIRKNKHSQGLRKLYGNYPVIQKMILGKGGSKQDAQDIFQEALIILCRKVENGNFELTASLGTYLYSICRFLWKDELKKRKRFNESDFNDEVNHLPDDELEQLQQNENNWKKAAGVLSTIGERCIELFKLFYFEKMSMEKIAEKMEFRSAKIAKNQKYKCLERARENLKKAQENH